MRKLSTALLFSLAALTPLAAQIPTPTAIQGLNYQLKFQDEFDLFDVGSYNSPWTNGVWFWNPPNPTWPNVTSDNVMNFTWNLGQSSMQTSASSLLAWRYGYFEALIKFTNVTGAWPAFWMSPVEARDNGATDHGEIDIVEWQSQTPSDIYTTWHEWNGATEVTHNAANTVTFPAGFDFSQWHKYAVLWTPGYLQWYFDDTLINAATITSSVVDQQHYFIILSMMVGSGWRAGDTTGVTSNLTMNVDWVRVWQAQ